MAITLIKSSFTENSPQSQWSLTSEVLFSNLAIQTLKDNKTLKRWLASVKKSHALLLLSESLGFIQSSTWGIQEYGRKVLI